MAEPTEPVEPTEPTEPTPAPEHEDVEEKYHVQVINLLQELCDLVKGLDGEEEKTPDDEPDNYEDADQFDNLLD